MKQINKINIRNTTGLSAKSFNPFNRGPDVHPNIKTFFLLNLLFIFKGEEIILTADFPLIRLIYAIKKRINSKYISNCLYIGIIAPCTINSESIYFKKFVTSFKVK